MEHFVTLFDSKYLAQGLALHESLVKNDFSTLWVICLDEITFNAITSINIETLRPIHHNEIETAKLLEKKASRSHGEYCWTLTPFTFLKIFEIEPNIRRVTYIDADIYFFRSYKEIFDQFEASNKNILITKHNYSSFFDKHIREQRFGKYCVQFIIVNNTKGARKVIEWWQDKCIEWCFSRSEDGKFGDQKYLDYWPILFDKDVSDILDPHFAIGPWNARSLLYSIESSKLIFYHFHGFRIISPTEFILFRNYKIQKFTHNLYNFYIDQLLIQFKILKKKDIKLQFHPKLSTYSKIKFSILRLLGFSNKIKLTHPP